MSELRLGDVIDDYCVKCRRLTNHSVVSMLNGQVAKVRCRSCYHDHDYLHEQIPPSKKDLKKAELFNAVLGAVAPPGADEALETEDADAVETAEVAETAEAPAVPETPPEPAAPKKRSRTTRKA